MNFVVSDVYLLSELDGDLRKVVNLSLNIQQNTIYHHTWLKKDYIDLMKQSSRGVLEKRCF